MVTSLFSTLWCFVLGLVAKVASTTECFSSSLAAENFVNTLRYWRCVCHAISNFARRGEAGTRANASRLGEDSDINLASQLTTGMPLKFKGILPLSSRET